MGFCCSRSGAVVFLQRFGGSTIINPDFPALVLDGVHTLFSIDDGVYVHPLDGDNLRAEGLSGS